MSQLLAHQFIIYVAVIEFYQDYESHVAYNEYFYTNKEDAVLCLQNMMDKELREFGGSWVYDQLDTYGHSSGDMLAYIREQVVNGPKIHGVTPR